MPLHGLLITRILLYYSIDLSTYPIVEVSATYHSKTFTTTGYVLVDNKWCKKDSTKAKLDPPKEIKSMSNPVLLMLKKLKELKDRLKVIEDGMMLLQKSTTKLLQLSKETSYDVGKVRLTIDGFK